MAEQLSVREFAVDSDLEVSANTAGSGFIITGAQTMGIQVTVSDSDSLSGASCKIQKSIDSTNGTNGTWFDVSSPSSQNITADGGLFFGRGELVDPEAKYYRVYYTISSGSFVANSKVFGKGLV